MAKLRLVTPDDYGALCGMLSAFPWEGLTPMPWEQRLRHWWDDNPAFHPGWERGWVLDEGEKLVGFLGSVPRRVAIDGQVAVSANATTWWVAPEHRKLSLSMLARFTAQKAAGHFNTTGSATTLKLLEAFGYVPFPGGRWSGESFLIVDPARIVAASLRQRGAQRGIPGIALAAGLVEATAPLGHLIQKWRLPEAGGAHRWEVLRRADQRFDGLAAATRARHGYSSERDAASINWYLDGEGAERKLLVACLRGDSLRGFALFLQRESGTLAGLPMFDCIDLSRADDDPEVVATLLAAVAEIARGRGIALVVLRHFDESLADSYGRLGLRHRVGPPRRDFVKLPPLPEQRGYYLTQFHGDFFI
jgi:hypothetical protein